MWKCLETETVSSELNQLIRRYLEARVGSTLDYVAVEGRMSPDAHRDMGVTGNYRKLVGDKIVFFTLTINLVSHQIQNLQEYWTHKNSTEYEAVDTYVSHFHGTHWEELKIYGWGARKNSRCTSWLSKQTRPIWNTVRTVARKLRNQFYSKSTFSVQSNVENRSRRWDLILGKESNR